MSPTFATYEEMKAHEIEVERAAWERVRELVAEIVEVCAPIYPSGDGEGGMVVGALTDALRERYGDPVSTRRAKDPTRLSDTHRKLHRIGERDGWNCAYCGVKCYCPCDPDEPHACLDHVLPRSRGGSDADENRVIACWPCNAAKSDRTPGEWGGPS